MSLNRTDFAAFFAALHGGAPPFAWQERLLDAVLDGGTWPEQVVAPTGAGKTAVIDVHVFAQALTAGQAGDPALRPPRRLALVVGRRVLVDDQYEYARLVADSLVACDNPVLAAVADRLWRLRDPEAGGSDRGEVSPLVFGRLRGGTPPSQVWRDHVGAAAVLCATPEMWGSRVLFRGYGSNRLAWPREAGLLAVDSVVVVDEAHLARQLLTTARRVSCLVEVADRQPVEWRPLQVVETTATPPAVAIPGRDGGSGAAVVAVGVEPEDLALTPVLADRLTRPKPVTIVPVAGWDAKQDKPRRQVAAAIVDAVVDQVAQPPDGASAVGVTHTVGCFVNTVRRAVEVTAELAGRSHRGRPLRVVTICGQTRPYDLARLRQIYPGLLAPGGNPEVDVIVSTQSLEVGVDLDLAGLVTELAPGSALAQRAGRVNRRGLRATGPVVVVVPDLEPGRSLDPEARYGPYRGDELELAVGWIRQLAGEPEGMSPWTVRRVPPPPSSARRMLFQRPELFDAWHWARTSDDLAAEPELDLWLAEDFDSDTTVGLVVRDRLPAQGDDAVRFLVDLPVQRHEVFPVPYRTAVAALTRPTTHEAHEDGPLTLRVSGQETALLTWRVDPADPGLERPRLRPGDLVVVDAATPLFTTALSTGTAQGAGSGFSPPIVRPPVGEDGQVPAGPTDDVLTRLADLDSWPRHQVGNVILRIEPGVARLDPHRFALLAKPLVELLNDPGTPHGLAALIADWLAQDAPSTWGMAKAAQALLRGNPKHSEIMIHRVDDGDLVRVLVRDRRRAGAEEHLRQTWTPAPGTVTLAAHQRDVAGRVTRIATDLGLPDAMVATLREAAVHHDDGKQDPRFQIRLGRQDPSPLLAKSSSTTTSARARENERACGLPAGWRHEQLSVLHAWPHLHAAEAAAQGVDPLLAARLVGTSHGHGRSGYPHTTADLLHPDPACRADDLSATGLGDLSQELFDAGGWDDLVERTHRDYGVWGCAYLEAVLRAADGQISQEGR